MLNIILQLTLILDQLYHHQINWINETSQPTYTCLIDHMMEKSGFADMSDLDKEPSNPHIPWKQLVTSFKEGGLTPA
jgi:hypothetical protein